MAAIIQKIESTLHKGGGDPKKAEERRRAAEAAKKKKEMERVKRGEGGGIVGKIKAKLHGGEGEHGGEAKGGMGGVVVTERIHGGAGERYGPMKQKEKL